MPNPFDVLKAMAVAAGVAGLLFLPAFGVGNRPWPSIRACAWPLGIGCGIVSGMWMMGVAPSGRFAGDQERLAFLVIPLITLAETLLTATCPSGWRALCLRVVVAWCICPMLLFGSVYMVGSTAVGQHGWTPAASAVLLTSVGAAVAVSLLTLTAMAQRDEIAGVTWCLGLTTLAAGLATMLSGYLTGGRLAMPIAAVMMAGSAMSPLFSAGPLPASGTSVGFVGLVGILMIGHFFGSLTVGHAVVLGVAPVLFCVVDLATRQALRPWQRGMLALACTTTLLVGVVWQAYDRFTVASSPSQQNASGTPTVDDYLNYGR